MKRKCFSVEHIVAVLKQAEWDTPVADPIRHLGIGSASAYTMGRNSSCASSDTG